MLFNSYVFLLAFLPVAVAVYAIADRFSGARIPVLVVLSLTFYSYWDIRFLPIMVLSILGNWLAARAFAATRAPAIITAAIVLDLAVLGVFKYTNFFASILGELIGRPLPELALVLPLGISFFTFHHIMYLVDLRRGRAPLYALDRYALYICFFPQAISGPIARWNEVMHQFGERAFAPGWEKRCAVGVAFIVIGLLQKTALADPLAHALDPVYEEAARGPLLMSNPWLAPAFALQIFFDFAGYSDIAIGLGLIFGVRLPRNFETPLRATGIRDFWRRWHMTLSRFLRDYLYIPLGGNRHGLSRQLAAMFVTMALGGLWHGAGWTFILWGCLHGFALGIATLWAKYLPPPPAVVGWVLTFMFVVATFVLFRAGSLAATWHIFAGLANAAPGHPEGGRTVLAALLCALLLPPSHVIVSRLTEVPRIPVALGLGAALCMILIMVGDRESYQFVYFQF